MIPHEFARKVEAGDTFPVETLEQMVRSVVRLHAPSFDKPRICLRGCGQWPCPTIREMAKIAP